MKLNRLPKVKGTEKRKKRIGRGESSGWGKTAGRGHNGQGQRAGGGKGPTFEGGSIPLFRRLPKLKGFKSLKQKDFQAINVRDLARFEEIEITEEMIVASGLVRKGFKVKLLGVGEIDRAVTLTVSYASEAAKEKITAAGGTLNLPEPPEVTEPLGKKAKRKAEAAKSPEETKAEKSKGKAKGKKK
jgi:large subunit ribosomal protein L15